MTVGHFKEVLIVASDKIKKILEAEAVADKKNAEARRLRDEIIESASGSSALSIQKKISEAASEASKIRADFDMKAETYKEQAFSECEKKLSELKKIAENNTDKAIDEIISLYF